MLDDESSLKNFLDNFSGLEGMKILVHGGGKIATQLGSRLGIGHHMVNGRRITDQQTLELVTMVYGGLINKNLVAKLQALSCNALGLCGADANIFPAVKRPVEKIDFGFVGDIAVDLLAVSRLELFLNAGLTMVIAPLTHDGEGNLLNTNADTMAAALAILLAEAYDCELIYCFEKEGVLDAGDAVISKLTMQQFSELVRTGVVCGGMVPKLSNAFEALQAGVPSVKIIQASALKECAGRDVSAGTTMYL